MNVLGVKVTVEVTHMAEDRRIYASPPVTILVRGTTDPRREHYRHLGREELLDSAVGAVRTLIDQHIVTSGSDSERQP